MAGQNQRALFTCEFNARILHSHQEAHGTMLPVVCKRVCFLALARCNSKTHCCFLADEEMQFTISTTGASDVWLVLVRHLTGAGQDEDSYISLSALREGRGHDNVVVSANWFAFSGLDADQSRSAVSIHLSKLCHGGSESSCPL